MRLEYPLVGHVMQQDVLEAERPYAGEASAVRLDDLLAHQRARGAAPARSGRRRGPAQVRPRRRTTSRPPRPPRRSARSPGSRRSRRAASSAWMVAGMANTDGSCSRWRSSISMRTSSSTNRGLPSELSNTRSERSAAAVAGVAHQVLHQRSALRAIQRLEVDPLAPETAAAKSGLASKSSFGSTATIKIGTPADRGRQVLEQLQEGRLGPVDVLDHDHERVPGRDRLQQLADRPERLRRVSRGRRSRPSAPATRSATEAWSSSAGSNRATLAWTSSALSPSSVPASSATISRSGQNVRPSP